MIVHYYVGLKSETGIGRKNWERGGREKKSEMNEVTGRRGRGKREERKEGGEERKEVSE